MNTANRVGAASKEAMAEAITSMTTLNKLRGGYLQKVYGTCLYRCNRFQLLGHLHEMLDKRLWAVVDTLSIPYIKRGLHPCGKTS